MPGIYQRTVNWTGENTSGPNYTWVDVNGAQTAGWITLVESSTADTWNFTISDWTVNPSGTRSAEFQVKHWLYSESAPDPTLIDSFTITQYADNSVEVTTTTTSAPITTSTTTTEAPITTTTTEAPITTSTTTTEAPSIYTITYEGNGADGGGVSATSGQLPLTVANNAFFRSGWTFENWNTDSGAGAGVSGSGTIYNPGDAYNVASNDILYAIWSFDNPQIAWDNAIAAVAWNTTSTTQGITTDSGTGAGYIFTYSASEISSGTGAGKLYFVDSATGDSNSAVAAPNWISGVTPVGATDTNGNGNVNISLTQYTQPPALDAPADGLGVDPMAALATLNVRTAYLAAEHPEGDIVDVLTIQQTQEPAATTTTLPVYTFQFNTTLTTALGVGQYSADFTFTGPSSAISESNFSISNMSGITETIDSVTFNPITDTGYVTFTLAQSSGSTDTTHNFTVDFTLGLNAGYVLSQSSTTQEPWQLDDTCIVAGTPILMADGSTKLVENIEVGDQLASVSIDGLSLEEDSWKTWSTDTFNSTASTTTVTRATGGQFSTYYEIATANGDPLKITSEHPVLSERNGTYSFQQVINLQVGDSILKDNSWQVITSINIVNETVQTYTIGAEDADNYIAGGVVVHNAPQVKIG